MNKNLLLANFVLVFFIIGFISAEIYIDPEIEKVFESSEWVDVFFKMNDISKADTLISNLSDKEFQLIGKSPNRIVGKITQSGFNKLINDSRVTEIYYNFPVEGTLSESVSLIEVDPQVWNLGYNGTGINVCVIDTGVNKTLSDLQGKIKGEACFCSAPEGGNSSCCYNGLSVNYGNNSAKDNHGHGTHVTGIIASQDSTYKGVAYGANIYVVKSLNSNNQGTIADIGDAIDWCRINASANVISISISNGQEYGPNGKNGTCINTIDTEINNAVSNDISVIIASGNNFYVNGTSYPACSPNTIAVGSSTKSDLLSVFTNRASRLDVLAPGSSIKSLRWNINSCIGGCTCSGEFMTCSGTSMATPHVAGAAALLLERDPTLTPDEIRFILKNKTDVRLYDAYTPSSGLWYSRINVSKAFNSICTVTNWTSGSCGAGSCLSSEREYTRTVNPIACDITTKCEYDTSCTGGGGGGDGSAEELTVCASGCNRTTIQGAVDISDANDRILVT